MSTYGNDKEKVHEIIVEDVVIEIYEKVTPDKRYYDYISKRIFYVDGEEKRGIFCQQRDCRNHIKALCDTQTWISDRHRELRDK